MKTVMCIFSLTLFILVCGCRSDRFELKYTEHFQLKENVSCEQQDAVIVIDTTDKYNRDAIGGLLVKELSRRSDGKIKGVYVPVTENATTNGNFVKVAINPNYSGGPGVNFGYAFGLASALVGEMLRDNRDYVAYYSGIIEARLKGRQPIRKEINLRATFIYEPGTVEDEEMIAECRDKFKTMTFSQRCLINRDKASGDTIAPILEAYLRRRYYPFLAEHLTTLLLE